jgi:hypothetical protein
VHDGPLHLAAVANGRYFGGGMHVAPAARIDDGLFDLVVFRGEGGKGRLLRRFPLLYSGRHVGLAEVSQQRGVVVEVGSNADLWLEIDGEPLGRAPARFECLPGAAAAWHRRVSGNLFATIRARAADVARAARFVRIDAQALARLAESLALDPPAPPVWDVTTHHRGSPRSTLAYVITLDAINFGSGWFPKLRKRNGRSGYFTVAMGLKDRFDAEGPWSARELAELSPIDLARVTGQDVEDPAVVELLALFATSLNDLGSSSSGATLKFCCSSKRQRGVPSGWFARSQR